MICENDQKPKVLEVQRINLKTWLNIPSKKKKVRTRTHGSFLNQGLDNTNPNPL
jgi:hypothetical protein